MAALSSLVLMRRSINWRLRALAIIVGLLQMCQGISLLGHHHILAPGDYTTAVETVQLLISILSLTTIHLLNRENSDRRSVDYRLRLAESMEQSPGEPLPNHVAGSSSQVGLDVRKREGETGLENLRSNAGTMGA